MIDIPNTRLTDNLRAIWKIRCQLDGSHPETFEEFYLQSCQGFRDTPPSINGRAMAALLFDRARIHWPDFFSPADIPAVTIWGSLLDDVAPLATPEIINRAVDQVAAAHQEPPNGPYYFLRAIEREIQQEGDGA